MTRGGGRTDEYDVVVVGARCGGSPTAMLLARRGYRVLVVEKHVLSREVVTGHYVHPPGVAYLAAWGLLDGVVAGCPPITRVTADLESGRMVVDYGRGMIELPAGRFRLSPEQCHPWPAYAPRRTVLDGALCAAAVAAGASYRAHTEAESLLIEDGRVVGARLRARTPDGTSGEVRARFVVGADGIHSLVAKQVGAQEYGVTPSRTCSYRSYWSGVACDGLEYYVRDRQSVLLMPTHEGLTWVSVGSPIERFRELRHDVEGGYLRGIAAVPEVGERVAGGVREERIVGTTMARTYYRRPFGPGWALVGDAGYHKDPSAGQGITDAFRDATALADALAAALGGGVDPTAALSAYEQSRNAASASGHALAGLLSLRSELGEGVLPAFAGFAPLAKTR